MCLDPDRHYAYYLPDIITFLSLSHIHARRRAQPVQQPDWTAQRIPPVPSSTMSETNQSVKLSERFHFYPFFFSATFFAPGCSIGATHEAERERERERKKYCGQYTAKQTSSVVQPPSPALPRQMPTFPVPWYRPVNRSRAPSRHSVLPTIISRRLHVFQRRRQMTLLRNSILCTPVRTETSCVTEYGLRRRRTEAKSFSPWQARFPAMSEKYLLIPGI